MMSTLSMPCMQFTMRLWYKTYWISYFVGVLAKMDRFKHKLSTVPQTPRPATEVDAVGTLLDICVQRNWPLAK